MLARTGHLWVLHRPLEWFVASQRDAGTVSIGHPEKRNEITSVGIPEGTWKALWVLVGPGLEEGDLARAPNSGSGLDCLSVTCTGFAALALRSTQVLLRARCRPPA